MEDEEKGGVRVDVVVLSNTSCSRCCRCSCLCSCFCALCSNHCLDPIQFATRHIKKPGSSPHCGPIVAAQLLPLQQAPFKRRNCGASRQHVCDLLSKASLGFVVLEKHERRFCLPLRVPAAAAAPCLQRRRAIDLRVLRAFCCPKRL